MRLKDRYPVHKCVHCNSNTPIGMSCIWCGKGGAVRDATEDEANAKRHVRPGKKSLRGVYRTRTGLFKL